MDRDLLLAIKKVFYNIPAKEILSIAKDIQKRLKKDLTLTKKKGEDNWDWVTKADQDIEKLLIDYFSSSPLRGTYILKAEESGTVYTKDTSWQLLIDPLDGTGSFRKQGNTWGVKVGAYDRAGVLQYSWNLVSSGNIFSTTGQYRENRQSLQSIIKKKGSIAIDVCNYKDNVADQYGEIFTTELGITENQLQLTSYPAAVWAGWELFQGRLDGLLWLPSEAGKKWYPDYDLIFLGALVQKGYMIRLGKIKDYNVLIAIGPSVEDVEMLYELGLKLIPKNQRNAAKKTDNPLQITNPIP